MVLVLVTERCPESESTTTLLLSRQKRLTSNWLELWSRRRPVQSQFGPPPALETVSVSLQSKTDGFGSQQKDHSEKRARGEGVSPLVFPSVLQGYHELYQLHRSRLETQLLQVMEERDCWIQLTFALAKKVSCLFNAEVLCWFLMGVFMPNLKKKIAAC